MFTVICFIAAIVSAQAYITTLQKSPQGSPTPTSKQANGIYFIPAGSCTGLLLPQQVECSDRYNRYYPSSNLQITVKDAGGYATIRITDDLTSAEVQRSGSCSTQAIVTVTFECSYSNDSPHDPQSTKLSDPWILEKTH